MGSPYAELVRRADAAARKARAAREQDEADEAAKRAAFVGRIFDRARETFDRCLAVARERAEAGSRNAEIQLYPGRFDAKDFAERVNEWQMVVIALRENGLKAEYVVREHVEYHELAGGDQVVHTPYIEMSWEK